MEARQALVAAPARRPLTTTERNWLWALALVVAGGLVFWGLARAEAAWGIADRYRNVAGRPVESSMRYLALSHFVVAIIFMTTSRSMRRPGSWLGLAGLVAVGAGLCWLFGRAGGIGAHLPAVVFYTYFLLHEFRDQAMFYRVNGDAPADEDPHRLKTDLLTAPLLGLALIGTVFFLAAAFRIGGARRFTDAVFGETPDTLRHVIGIVPVVAMIAIIHLKRRSLDRRYPGGAVRFLAENRPIFFVFGGILLVLLLGIPLTGTMYPIVTLHVTAWYVFVARGFARRPAPDPYPRALTWRWVRSTNAGFHFVHLGVLALILLAGLIWVYGYGSDPSNSALRFLVSREAFPYWTIMHVTISWLPK